MYQIHPWSKGLQVSTTGPHPSNTCHSGQQDMYQPKCLHSQSL